MYFGSYEPDYSRNRIIKKGLIASRIKVFDDQASGLLPFRYFKLLIQFLKLHKKINAMIIGFPGYYDVPLAFILGKLFKKIVFYDVFASTYETYALDRKVVSPESFRARFYYFVDWLGLHLADYVIVDTLAHGKFYSILYGLNHKKQIVVYVGSDSDYFYPRETKEQTDVLFYGSYQPLQGTDIIVKAASRLPKIKFKLIGEGQTRKAAENLSKKLKLKNIEFINWLPLEKLAEEISKAKICLGIFGNTQKAKAVIPNKVFDYLASAKPFITADTQATKELLKNNKNAVLIPAGNFQALTLAISELNNNLEKQQKISKSGYNLFLNLFDNEFFIKNLILKFNQL